MYSIKWYEKIEKRAAKMHFCNVQIKISDGEKKNQKQQQMYARQK